MLFVLRVVAQKSPIAESERLPLLLAQLHALYRLSSTVALGELVGVGVGLDGAAVLLGADERQVLVVIGPQRLRLRTAGALRHTDQAIPGSSLGIQAVRLNRVDDAPVRAGLVISLADFIPSASHSVILLY